MEIIENDTLIYSPIKYAHEEYDSSNEEYNIYFAYILENVTGCTDFTAEVSSGEQPKGITVEHCKLMDTSDSQKCYVVHVVLGKYLYYDGEQCNRTIKIKGSFLRSDIPVPSHVNILITNIGCKTE